MKRKLLCIFLAVVLAFSLSVTAFSQKADIFFVALNDTISVTLSEDIAPYSRDGVIYVPYSVFTIKGTGVTPSMNTDRNTLALFSRFQRLIFDLTEQKVTDEKGVTTAMECPVRNGIAFVPLRFCAEHFGLKGSLVTSQGGYAVVRFQNGQQVYDDAQFIVKAETLISYRVQEYLAQQGTVPEKPTPTDPVDPVDPPDPEIPERLPPTVYLVAVGEETAPTAVVLADRNDLPLTLFLTEREIAENADLVRLAYASGMTVGLTVEQDTADVAASLRRANEALSLVIGTKTLLVWLNREQSQGVTGYLVMDSSLAVDAATAIQLEMESMVLCTEALSTDLNVLNMANTQFRPLRETAPFRLQ